MEYTTKQSIAQAFDTILSPIKENLARSAGQPSFGSTATVYGQDAIYAEGFLRPLWGLAPLWRGGGGDEETKCAMRRGVICGTDPASPHYWGLCGRYDQRFVEMAPLAFSLLLTPEVMWDPLTDAERVNLHAWMSQINDYVIPDNNWRFFRVLVNLAFKHRGVAYNATRMEEDLAAVERFYLGGGWYSDGVDNQRDYYVAWAIHFYGLVYSLFENDEHAEAYRARARVFAEDFVYWFSERGCSIPYGRSLTYRLAQGSFFSMCLLAGVEVFDLGVMKGILSRHLDDWLSSPIFDNGGVLTIGYKYPNLYMAEHYNAPGSPFWAAKFFALLALPDDHPFWIAPAKPLPPLREKKLLREANMLVTREGGDAFCYPAGTIENAAFGQMTAKYLKFVYSTRFGINMKLGDIFPVDACTDSSLVFDVGGVFCDRRRNLGAEVTEDKLTIHWSPMEGITVSTEIIPDGASHTRRHTITSDYAVAAYDCGFAVAAGDADGYAEQITDVSATAENSASRCCVRPLDTPGTPLVIATTPNANIVFPKTRLPAVKYEIPRGTTVVVTRVEGA